MRSLLFSTVIAFVLSIVACGHERSAESAGLDSAGAVAVALKLAGPDRPPGFGVLGLARDTGGYLVDLGPPAVLTNARGDTVAAVVGGRMTVRVRRNGEGKVLYRGQ
jgi:hypothetical protein